MNVVVVVQRIDLIWDKRKRDVSSRELRARIPRACALPDALMHSSGSCLKDIRGIVVCDDKLSTARGSATSAIRLSRVGAELEVAYTGEDAGEPLRPRKSMRLPSGRWMRVQYNGRFQPTSPERGESVSYKHTIINIAFGMKPVVNLFLGKPDVEFDILADL